MTTGHRSTELDCERRCPDLGLDLRDIEGDTGAGDRSADEWGLLEGEREGAGSG